MTVSVIGPSHLCDRCDHPLLRHAAPDKENFMKRGAWCLYLNCPCDGYVPKPVREVARGAKSDAYRS